LLAVLQIPFGVASTASVVVLTMKVVAVAAGAASPSADAVPKAALSRAAGQRMCRA
jgi:hypothetical protein